MCVCVSERERISTKRGFLQMKSVAAEEKKKQCQLYEMKNRQLSRAALQAMSLTYVFQNPKRIRRKNKNQF